MKLISIRLEGKDDMLINRINSAQGKLTDTDFNVLNYLMTHKQDIENMSIHEIAEKAYVSAASIVRVAKKLDFSGFSELKYSLKNEHNDQTDNFKSSISLLEQDIHDTLNLIMEQNLLPICQQIGTAKRILIYGTDWGEKSAASYFARNFVACNILIYQIPSITEFLWSLEQMNENNLVIILSFSGDNPDLKRLIPSLKMKNIPVLSITPLSGNYLSSNSTFRLYYKVTDLDFKNAEKTEYNFFSPLYVLTDFLFRYYHDNYFIDSSD